MKQRHVATKTAKLTRPKHLRGNAKNGSDGLV